MQHVLETDIYDKNGKPACYICAANRTTGTEYPAKNIEEIVKAVSTYLIDYYCDVAFQKKPEDFTLLKLKKQEIETIIDALNVALHLYDGILSVPLIPGNEESYFTVKEKQANYCRVYSRILSMTQTETTDRQ